MLKRQSQSSYFPHSQSSFVEDEDVPSSSSSLPRHSHTAAGGFVSGRGCLQDNNVVQRYTREQDRNDFHRQEDVYQRMNEVALLNHGIHFPKNVAVLWDREGLTAPRYVGCQDIVPPLILTRDDIKKLLKALQFTSLSSSSSSPTSSVAPSSPTSSTSEMMGSVLEFGLLSEEHQRALSSNPSSVLFSSSSMNTFSTKPVNSRGTYGFVLDQSSGRGPDTSMTIPIMKKDPNQATVTDLAFDTNNTEMLKLHLWKALRSGRSFGLRHFLRMRAIGFSSSNKQYFNASTSPKSTMETRNSVKQNTHLKGVVKFEVIVPDITFQFLGIPAIPILATPLCLSLLPSSPSNGEEDSLFACFDQKPNMGFVTMNQTRKVVFVLESDANALSRIPMIGVWLRLPPEAIGYGNDGNVKLNQAIDHPLCWAACVRFLFSDKVQERVFIAHETFLMVILVGDAVQFFEVTMANSKKLDQQFTSTGALSKKSCDLISLDFTAELSVDDDDGQDRGNDHLESLVCKFRSNLPKALKPHEESFTNQNSVQSSYIPVKPSVLMSVGVVSKNNQSLEADSLSQLPPEPRFAPTPVSKPNYVHSSMELPKAMEQSSIDSCYSVPSSAACYSSMITANKDINHKEAAGFAGNFHHSSVAEEMNKISQQSLAYYAPGVIPGHVLGIETGPMMYTFPAQIITAQQRQIEMLQRQVEEMRQLLVSVGGLNNIAVANQQQCVIPTETNITTESSSSVMGMKIDNGSGCSTSNSVASSTNFSQVRSSVNNNSSMMSTATSNSDLISFGSLPIPSSTATSAKMTATAAIESKSEKKSSKQSPKRLPRKKGKTDDTAAANISEDMVDLIESQYLPTLDDKEEVLDRLIPNLHEVPMQTIVVSQQQPDVLLRMSDEEVIVSTMTYDDKELNEKGVSEEEPSIYDIPSNTISSLSPSSRRVPPPSTVNALLFSGNHSGRLSSNRSIRYTHKLPSQSTAMRIAEEEASNFYESESILAIQTKYMSVG